MFKSGHPQTTVNGKRLDEKYIHQLLEVSEMCIDRGNELLRLLEIRNKYESVLLDIVKSTTCQETKEKAIEVLTINL